MLKPGTPEEHLPNPDRQERQIGGLKGGAPKPVAQGGHIPTEVIKDTTTRSESIGRKNHA